MADESARLEQLRRRVQADPASIAFAALAEEYRRAGHLAEAIETARAGLRHHPAYVSARVTLGRALLEAGEPDQAREELEQALAAAPENLAALRALADLHRQSGSLARARDLARRGLALAPHDREWRVLVDQLGKDLATREPGATIAFHRPAAGAPTPAPKAAHVRDAVEHKVVVAPHPVADNAETSTVSPTPPAPAGLAALERWLGAIVRERRRREAGSGSAVADLDGPSPQQE